MKLTYLNNSGFALEKGNDLLIIDCFNPKAHPMLDAKTLSAKNSVTSLVSHSHSDHYSKDIWELPLAKFAVSFDVPKLKEAVALSPGEQAIVNGIELKAYGSTDEGISFHINWDGLSIFHAGDLNFWHWADESTKEYVLEAKAQFLEELSRIQAGVKALDLAFFPVDKRMGSDYYRGAVMFLEALKPKHFMPMHFGAEFNPPQRFFDEISTYTKLLFPPPAGKTIELPF